LRQIDVRRSSGIGVRGFAYGRRDIPAHMTIAKFLTIEDSLRICADLIDLRKAAKRVTEASSAKQVTSGE
jgi:hypothetical protein